MPYGRLVLSLTVILTWTACGGSGGSSPVSGSSSTAPTPTAASPNTSTLTVWLKDSPFSDAKALLVTFSEVSVHRSGGDFRTLPFVGGASARTCDLKKLTTGQDMLGTGPLPTGHYTQVRLMVTSATLYFDNASSGPACATAIAAPAGTNAIITIPSSELKLNREFDVNASSETTILLDFDGDRSVKQTGKGRYMMTLVIAVVSVQ